MHNVSKKILYAFLVSPSLACATVSQQVSSLHDFSLDTFPLKTSQEKVKRSWFIAPYFEFGQAKIKLKLANNQSIKLDEETTPRFSVRFGKEIVPQVSADLSVSYQHAELDYLSTSLADMHNLYLMINTSFKSPAFNGLSSVISLGVGGVRKGLVSKTNASTLQLQNDVGYGFAYQASLNFLYEISPRLEASVGLNIQGESEVSLKNNPNTRLKQDISFNMFRIGFNYTF